MIEHREKINTIDQIIWDITHGQCEFLLGIVFIKNNSLEYALKIMVLIQSIVQIILESLPISSSGHLTLVQKMFYWQPLSQACEYILHGPTILILIVYFRKTWFALLMHCWRYRILIMRMIMMGAAADLATVPIYESTKFLFAWVPLYIGFLITAAVLYSVRFCRRDAYQPLTYTKAALIGVVQGIAGITGISRLATTYAAGVWLGLSPRKSFYVSCMIQFPIICAGFVYGLWQGDSSCTQLFVQPISLLALCVATCIAYILLWWVQQIMQQGTVWKFAAYMLAPILVSFFLF